MSFPKYPFKGEPWAECSICGLDFPQSELVRHYKSKKLVDNKCADVMTHSDNMELVERPIENENRTIQPVHNQGQDPSVPYTEGGAGSGGAGGGGAGGDYEP